MLGGRGPLGFQASSLIHAPLGTMDHPLVHDLSARLLGVFPGRPLAALLLPVLIHPRPSAFQPAELPAEREVLLGLLNHVVTSPWQGMF